MKLRWLVPTLASFVTNDHHRASHQPRVSRSVFRPAYDVPALPRQKYLDQSSQRLASNVNDNDDSKLHDYVLGKMSTLIPASLVVQSERQRTMNELTSDFIDYKTDQVLATPKPMKDTFDAWYDEQLTAVISKELRAYFSLTDLSTTIQKYRNDRATMDDFFWQIQVNCLDRRFEIYFYHTMDKQDPLTERYYEMSFRAFKNLWKDPAKRPNLRHFIDRHFRDQVVEFKRLQINEIRDIQGNVTAMDTRVSDILNSISDTVLDELSQMADFGSRELN